MLKISFSFGVIVLDEGIIKGDVDWKILVVGSIKTCRLGIPRTHSVLGYKIAKHF